MLSHDTRLRCDLVDLYYALYGSRRPACLPIPELAGIMKSSRSHIHDMKRIKSIHSKPANVPEIKRTDSPIQIKEEPNNVVVVEDNMNVLDIEVVVADDPNKVKIKVISRNLYKKK